jgi:hypothetical protein
VIIFLTLSTFFGLYKIAVSFVTSTHLNLKCTESLPPYCICVKTVDHLRKEFHFTVRHIIFVIKVTGKKVIANEAKNNVRIF